MKPELFLGVGWRFPILPDASGRLGYAEGADSIRDCLIVLVQTAVGERVMRPDFGTRAPHLLFAPGSDQNRHELEESIRSAVRDYEPRVELEQVFAETDPVDQTQVRVSITYRIRRSDTRANLVISPALGAGAG